MGKQDTLILKGIALLMMVMVHIDTSKSVQFICWGGDSLWKLIKGGCSPVAFFLMLSGYGLRYMYENGDKHHYGRILKLFVHYWTIMLLFVVVGYFLIGADSYPGDIKKFIMNFTSFHTSYNYECWFIFPFVILSLSYPIIFKMFDKLGLVFLLISFFLYFASGYIISSYGLIYKTAPYLEYNLLQIFFMLPSFLFGGMLVKYDIGTLLENEIKKYRHYKIIALTIIGGVLVFYYYISTTAFGPFTALLMFLMLFSIVKGSNCRVLQLIGRHSMNIWMIHTYFLHYIAHDFVYSFKYSFLIMVVTLLLSLLCSFIINYITNNIDTKIYELRI